MFRKEDDDFRWDKHDVVGFCSENVEILFYAVYNMSKDIGEKAAVIHNRSIMDHIVELVSLSVSFF